ncbi:MAG TPA: glycosyltransferase family A protein [Ktedonobacteraceae bacterium]
MQHTNNEHRASHRNLLISVVVPTYKRPDPLERCLKALLTQNLAATAYEIIVVDGAAWDTTRKQVNSWTDEAQKTGHTIRYIPLPDPNRNLTVARNHGWQAASSKIIAFTNDDCIPEMNWLQAGLHAFTDNVAVVSGRIVMPLPPKPTDYEYNAFQITKTRFTTANCFYQRSVLVQAGGFDERFATVWQEGNDLYLTLLQQDIACIFVPEVVVMRPASSAPWGISLTQQHEKTFDALLYKKHPILYRKHIQTPSPWHHYITASFLLLALFSLLTPIKLLAIIFLLAWLYMTGRFCIQRLRKTSHAPGHVLEMIVTSIFIPLLAVLWRLWGMIRFRVFFFQ